MHSLKLSKHLRKQSIESTLSMPKFDHLIENSYEFDWTLKKFYAEPVRSWSDEFNFKQPSVVSFSRISLIKIPARIFPVMLKLRPQNDGSSSSISTTSLSWKVKSSRVTVLTWKFPSHLFIVNWTKWWWYTMKPIRMIVVTIGTRWLRLSKGKRSELESNNTQHHYFQYCWDLVQFWFDRCINFAIGYV